MRKSEQFKDGLYICGAVILVAAFLSISSNKPNIDYRVNPLVDYVANQSACQNQAKRVKAKNWEFNNLSKECKYK